MAMAGRCRQFQTGMRNAEDTQPREQRKRRLFRRAETPFPGFGRQSRCSDSRARSNRYRRGSAALTCHSHRSPEGEIATWRWRPSSSRACSIGSLPTSAPSWTEACRGQGCSQAPKRTLSQEEPQHDA
jgi:hypothetical protein